MKHKCMIFLMYFLNTGNHLLRRGRYLVLGKKAEWQPARWTDSCEIHEEMMKEVIILAVVQYPKPYNTHINFTGICVYHQVNECGKCNVVTARLRKATKTEAISPIDINPHFLMTYLLRCLFAVHITKDSKEQITFTEYELGLKTHFHSI